MWSGRQRGRGIFSDISASARDRIMAQDTRPASRYPVIVLKGAPLTEPLTSEEAERRLAPLTRPASPANWAKSDLLDADELARHLGVSMDLIAEWRSDHQILALHDAEKGDVYPLRQFDLNVPVKGMREVRAAFSSETTMWFWMVGPNGCTGREAPIDHLRNGHIAQVVGAARGAWGFQ